MLIRHERPIKSTLIGKFIQSEIQAAFCFVTIYYYSTILILFRMTADKNPVKEPKITPKIIRTGKYQNIPTDSVTKNAAKICPILCAAAEAALTPIGVKQFLLDNIIITV